MFNSHLVHSSLKSFSRCSVSGYLLNIRYIANQSLQTPKKQKIGAFGWALLIIPASTFALGTWQVQRKKWKENLIEELQNRTNIQPIMLPKSLEEINDLEYHPVHVRGHFIHQQEMYLGPRSLLKGGAPDTSSSLISDKKSTSRGYLVVTPFKLSDRPQTILVNRGWVSHNNKDPKTRSSGQVQGEVDLTGIIRLHENRPQFMPKSNPEENSWFYRDVKQMSEVVGATPIFLDATNDFTFKGGPIAGQTLITLRNEHLTYIMTWYGLSAFTSFMWYSQFIKGVRI